jgi:hypothetical protein
MGSCNRLYYYILEVIDMAINWTGKYAITPVGDTELAFAQAILDFNGEFEDVMFDSVEEALDYIKKAEESVGGKVTRVIKIGDVVYGRCGGEGLKDSTFKICLVEIAEEM